MTGTVIGRGEILNRIRQLMAEIVDDDALRLSEAMTAADVPDWDSINHIKLMIALESELKVHFETDEVTGVQNVGQLIDLIQKKL